MGVYHEIWTRPGDPNFGRVIDDPPFRQATIQDAVNARGHGSMQMPNNFPRFDDLLKIDGTSSVSSLVRVRSDVDDEIVYEWIPQALNPTSAKNDPYHDLSGWSIKSILSYARTEAYDWDGSDDWVCNACDWIWGGTNIISNWDFESSQVTPTSYTIEIIATGGTYTISDGTDTTAALAFNALSAAISSELESFASITDVAVADAGSSPITRLITFVVPPFGVALTLNPAGLTGTGTITETETGGLSPAPWTTAATLARGLPQNAGGYTVFEVSTAQNHTPGGQYSLAIDPGPSTATSNRNPGAQVVLTVKPGFTYQASIWVRPTSATDRFRLGIFGIGDEIIAFSSWNGQTLTANVWNQISISDVVIPDDVRRVIFRIQATNTGPSDPALFYVDDAEFNEGLAATTPGEIIRFLYEHATDSVLRNPIVWDDGAGNPYLTLDFTDALDSAGVAWAHSEVKLYIYMRMTLLQVLQQLASMLGIEFRVVPDNEETGTWLLQVYNKDAMRTVQDVAIQGGASDVHRQVRRFLPDTDYLVEGRERVTARAADTSLRTALGRMETGRLDRELPSEDAAQDAVAEDAGDAQIGVEPWSYELVDPQDQPLTAYRLGDEIYVHDPPEADGEARLWDYVATFTSEAETWEVDLLPE